MITLNQAIELVREVEEHIAPSGFHTALTGGCLYRGSSEKDIDVVIYLHRCLHDPFPWEELREILTHLGFGPFEDCMRKREGDYPDLKQVYKSTFRGFTIDLFIL